MISSVHFSINTAHSVPTCRSRCWQNANHIGSSGSSKRKSGSNNQEIIGVTHQSLLQGSTTGITQDQIKVIRVAFHYGSVIIKHFFFRYGVAIRSSLRQVRVNSPTKDKLAGCFFEGTKSQDGNIWAVLGGPKDGGSSQRKASDGLGIYCLGNLLGSNNDSVGGGVIWFWGILVHVLAIVNVSFHAVNNALLHSDTLFRVLWRIMDEL